MGNLLIATNAQVALNTLQYDGWLMRFANEVTNGVNSISAIYPSTVGLDVKVPYYEEIYQKENLPCVFKLTEDDKELNEYLEAHGYKIVAPTDVITLDLREKSFPNEALIAKAKESGAQHSYLQVVRTNTAAVNLYLKLRYEKVYTYWYMKKC